MKITADLIRKLKEETGAPVMRVKKVLEEYKGDEKKALEVLTKEGFEKAAKREGRDTLQGKIFSYTHHTGKIVSVVELLCETDFVARNELFQVLGKDLSLQAASVKSKNTEEFLDSDFIKDPSKKIKDLVKEVIAKTGENIKVNRVLRFEIGDK